MSSKELNTSSESHGNNQSSVNLNYPSGDVVTNESAGPSGSPEK